MSRQSQKISELEKKVAELKSAVAELEVLNEIAVSASKAVDVDQILNLIVQKSIKTIDAEQGSILLLTSDKKKPLKTIIRQDDTSSLKHNYHVSKNITGWVLLKEKPIIIENLAKDKRFKPTKEEMKDIRSVLCVPIWFEGRITGLMMLINKKNSKHFSQNDLTLLSIIAVQAGQLIKNLQLQKESLLKRKETEKLQEIDRIKTIFFTNISHEFRTPLTLILGPSEKILSDEANENTKKEAALIKRNATRLLTLVNQLLDLSKLEAGKLKLQVSKGNIVSFVKGVAMSFESLAKRKNIQLILSSDNDDIELYFDKDKMAKILSNLISNAFKFTREGGEVIVLVKFSHTELVSASSYSSEIPNQIRNDKIVTIRVKDTGKGISEEDLPKLFDRFYQVDASEHEGTGIGLALTKELVELHHGNIRVLSRIGEGSEFIFELPLGREHFNNDEIIIEKETENNVMNNLPTSNLTEVITGNMNKDNYLSRLDEDFIETTEDKNIILIVEDNIDVREYIKDSLSSDYLFEEAINGEQGLIKAEQIIPDLIISDIMMPKMDGNELSGKIKNNEKTSHIPVILLTAKSELESKLEGLETGADDYLTKPFDTKELQIRIKNLIGIRKKLQDKYSRGDYVPVKRGKKKLSNLEELFMNKVTEVINKHLSEEDFSIEQFGKEVGMDRVQLHRKLKALSGKSPSNYLRSVRLVKAKRMISEKKGNVSEIAYAVGFSSPTYFTRCFREEFGRAPSDLIN